MFSQDVRASGSRDPVQVALKTDSREDEVAAVTKCTAAGEPLPKQSRSEGLPSIGDLVNSEYPPGPPQVGRTLPVPAAPARGLKAGKKKKGGKDKKFSKSKSKV